MHYRAESESVPRINVSVDFVGQEWYKVLTRKATPISQLEERALVAAGMSMLWVPKNPMGIPVYGYQGKVEYSLLNVLDPKAASAMVDAILPEGRPVIVLSSEGSDRSRESLIPRSPRASPAQGAANEPVNEPVADDADSLVETAEQLETRKKKKLDKSEKKEKKVEENVAEAPRKQPSNHLFLDYVVVSDTLSGLDTGEKRAERDPDDDATLTEIMKKKKALEDKKKELDEQAAAALAAKRSKLQKETPPAPSESDVYLGVFSAKRGNLLEKIFAASGSQGVKSGKVPRKVDISKITPPTYPPSRTFGLSPPHADRGKRKEDDVEVEQVGEGGGDARGAGDVGAGAGGGGVDVQGESSEAIPQHTIYTKVIRGSGQGGASGTHHSPEYEHVQGGSWDTHNPACADLLHAPRWNLTQGSRMTELANCQNWEAACERTNKELQSQRDAIVRLTGEKSKISDKAEQERVAHQKREQEYIQRIAKLKKFAAEKVAENKASEILVEEITADCKWLLAHAVPLISERIAGSEELAKYMYNLGEVAYAHGRKEGYAEGRAAAEAKEPLNSFDLYKTDCAARYAEKRQELESLEFTIVKAAGKLSRKPDGIALLKRALGEEEREAGGAGTSHQE
ncbi:hypothetical protein HanPI659440_Chr01g0020251 [Helianthus annuus]|nr:hypothetical protein HanPI659440_Chr01g0020251 [Helianthus annuus]